MSIICINLVEYNKNQSENPTLNEKYQKKLLNDKNTYFENFDQNYRFNRYFKTEYY